ncbi:MAG: Eco57I restriction-modification methylase domain-containing protein, partial [Bacteroidales bacterium]|nr:Eco57I restriction-modification methylase domain-containing protein [Bacteroidales bacterium]
QLSLYLKLLEDETTATANEMMVLFHEKILPDMSKNIICGNSLIGTDILTDSLLTGEEERKLNPMNFETAFPDVFKDKKEQGYIFVPDIGIDEEQDTDSNTANEPMIPYKKRYKGGFDAIIGNPPYVYTRDKGITNIEKSYYYSNYHFQSPQLNTFGLFIEKAFTILNYKGSLGYIIPNNWLSIDSFSLLRKFIIDKIGNICIVNILDKVFKAANVDTCMLLYENNKEKVLNVSEMKNSEICYSKNINIDILSPPFYNFQINLIKNANNFNLINKIELNSQPLSYYSIVSTGVKVYQTGKGTPKQTDYEKKNRIFHSINPENEYFKKYLEGKDVCRYYLGWSGEYLNYGDWIAEPRKSVPFTGERLLIRQIPSKGLYMVNAIFTNETFINDINSMVVFKPKDVDLKFLLAIINSKLISYWFDKKFDKLQRNIFPQFKVKELSIFPISKINIQNQLEKSKHDKLVQLVEQIIKAKKQLQSAKTERDKSYFELRCKDIDRQIDKIVYELYDLTPDEIDIVEGK